MRSLCAKVPINKGDIFRKKLLEEQLVNNKLIIKHNENYLFIPLQKKPREELLDNYSELELDEQDFNSYPKRITDYRELLDLPADLMKQLPNSFDHIGTIAIVKIPKDLLDIRLQIGEAILKTHNGIKTVAIDFGVKGQLRLRDIEIIAGERNTETTHIEYGIRLQVDIAKAYFSPRLSTEHYRISQIVKTNEVILDMFAGVGPFSILISKYSEAKQIFSIDLNKYAIEYLIKNIDSNKVRNIFPLEGDVTEMIKKIPKVDRIIMNLPTGGREYLFVAFAVLKPHGWIHYHEMVNDNELQQCMKWLEEFASKQGFKLVEIAENNLGSYSANVNHYCFDMLLRLNK
jgi:tRNA (guanine37-N1)-methyltransferase